MEGNRQNTQMSSGTFGSFESSGSDYVEQQDFEVTDYLMMDEWPEGEPGSVFPGYAQNLGYQVNQVQDYGGGGSSSSRHEEGTSRENRSVLERREVKERVAFKTKSEVEILDDGYKWRKYGKKMVKNSPNPRNYYKCSVDRCPVKKKVERDRDDPTSWPSYSALSRRLPSIYKKPLGKLHKQKSVNLVNLAAHKQRQIKDGRTLFLGRAENHQNNQMLNAAFSSLDSSGRDYFEQSDLEISDFMMMDKWLEWELASVIYGNAGRPKAAQDHCGTSSQYWEDNKSNRKNGQEKKERVAFKTKSEVEILDDGYKCRKCGKKKVKNSPNRLGAAFVGDEAEVLTRIRSLEERDKTREGQL
ncbi:WRKY Transcription Factor [Ancistrocladus abbreviatus]